MKKRVRRILPALAAAGLIVAGPPDASASSHMDAPLIVLDDAANTTDVYAFVREQNGRKLLVTALGVYPFEDHMDDSGPGTEPMRLVLAVTVRGADILIDFDGTGPQTESGMNSYVNYTRSYCYAAVKCLTDPYGPQNDGAFRPVRIEAPLGSFLNPRPPAGGGPRAVFCYRLFDAVIGALAPALPGRVTAAGSHFANPTCGGFDPRRNRRTVVYELILSGTAARPDRDGCEALSMAFNASNIPVESQEANQPVLIERFELIRDSGSGYAA